MKRLNNNIWQDDKDPTFTNSKNFIRGDMVEVYELTLKDNSKEYISTFKCNKHVGCECGYHTMIKLLKNSRPRYNKIVSAIPYVTREISNDKLIIYQPLNKEKELEFYTKLSLKGRKERKNLLEEYGNYINATFETVEGVEVYESDALNNILMKIL
jgi:hypothetical protein